MTVCIAALSDSGKKAVLIADKLVTTNGILPYQSEAAADKILKINDNVSVMYAGGLVDANSIIEEAKRTIGGKKFVKEIAEHINDKHLNYLHKIIERRDIVGRGFKSISEFYRDKSINLPDSVRQQIDSNLATNTLTSNTSFIVCGKENDGLFKIYLLGNNPRFIPQLKIENYGVIGSGSGYANFSVIQSKYESSLSSNEVEDILKKAKREAEKDRDVGNKEDLLVLG